ncbi:MAG: SUMF1/EgtB/PvdO family nonheme iron enzyme [Azospirillum sp.]|nr:SUMF1/EgtB/PvdO family nonheme iron enzyme [Azospirillum sp.]
MVDSPPLGGVTAQWQGVAAVLRPDAVPEEIAWAETRSGALPLPKAAKGSCQVRFGLDHGFGVFADLEIATEHGAAVQRLRWIEPGSFRMGSPADEPEREEREGPRHWVTLTRGFWLADSACTQAMWRAVTGTDPSEFKGSDRPVERVSWPDVQGFLARLEALVPGCGAALPSEAEWEYACRAGTETPFSFGATVTTDQANFKGDFPYAGGPKGQWRRETVAVKSLPPNPWGLFEMHGNVREWCTDGMRTYGDQSVTDPQGPLDSESLRACRGGSWLDFARRVRSAFRIAVLPGDANDYLGFRFCLRSIEPSSGWPGGPPGRAPGRRPAAPPRDEAEPARGSGSTSKSRKQRSPRKR